MSGPARTALVEVTMKFEITDTATEGEMLDEVIGALVQLDEHIALRSPNGKIKRTGLTTSSVTTKSVGGHL